MAGCPRSGFSDLGDRNPLGVSDVRMNGKPMQKITLRWRTLVDGRKGRAPFAFLRSRRGTPYPPYFL